jgi:histidinol-phosphate phosphatase family protein
MTQAAPPQPRGILFDRDGTLVVDVPFNSEPARVEPLPTAAEAVRRARAAGLRVGVATNQPGIGSGELSRDALERVNARIDELIGPFDGWFVCPHPKDAGCDCRKPAPGLVEQAARAWGLASGELALIGDTKADVGAARSAGATGVLVPNERTLPEEVTRAPQSAATLLDAVELLLAPAAAGRTFAGVRS